MYPQPYGQILLDAPDGVTGFNQNVSAMENLDVVDPTSFVDMTEESIMSQLSIVLPYDDPQLLEALSILDDGHGNEMFNADDPPMIVPVGWSPLSSGAESDDLAIGTSSRSGSGTSSLGLHPVPSCSSWSESTFADRYSPASTGGRVLPSIRKVETVDAGGVQTMTSCASAAADAGASSGNAWMTSCSPSSSRSSTHSTSDSDNQTTSVPDSRELNRRERRREQNRRAALKCRTRRKQTMNDMAKNFVALNAQRTQYVTQISWLTAQVADMERTLRSHEQSCHCTLRNNINNGGGASSTSGS